MDFEDEVEVLATTDDDLVVTNALEDEVIPKEKKHVTRRKIEEALELRRMRDEGGWFDEDLGLEFE